MTYRASPWKFGRVYSSNLKLIMLITDTIPGSLGIWVALWLTESSSGDTGIFLRTGNMSDGPRASGPWC